MGRSCSKFIGMFLSVTMMFGIAANVPVFAAKGEVPFNSEFDPENGRILHYSFQFDNQNSTEIPDDSGKGKTGVLKNYDQANIVDETIYGKQVKALKLNGGSEGGYLQMPAGVFDAAESATISCWVKVNEESGYQRIWDFGNNTTEYMYLLTDGQNEGERGFATAITKSGWSNEEGVELGQSLGIGQWIFTTVVIDGNGKTISLYKDGNLIGAKPVETTLKDLGKTENNYIGYGQFGNDPFNGEITDFSIYDYAMAEDEVQSLCEIPDADRVLADKEALNLGDLDEVVSDLELPTKGMYGSEITWKSNNTDVIRSDGTVTRPASGESDASVILTATLKYGEATDTKDFHVKVLANPTDEEIAKHDVEKIDLGNLDNVFDDIDLPTSGEWGSRITWVSSNPDIIDSDGQVTRPTVDLGKVQATLTATATMNEKEASKSFKVTVLPGYSYPAIKEVSNVQVTTTAGVSPKFPSSVEVTYTDGTKGTVQVHWPDFIEADKYASAGTFDITGTIYDTDVTVTARVTVKPEANNTAPKIEAIENDLSATNLTGDTILTRNRQRDIDYLLRLDPDRMLYNFRNAFGVDTKGAEPLGGWDASDGLLRGHSTGHFLSALALAYASTKSSMDPNIQEENKKLKVKLDYMVDELSKLQDMSKGTADKFVTQCTPSDADQSKWSKDPSTWGSGFLSAYSPDQFALLEKYTPYATIWAPYYTYHKILAGMLDCYKYGENKTALKVAKGMGDWVYTRLSKCTTEEQRNAMWNMYIAGEYGGMNESLINLTQLYQITKDSKYIDAAKMFDNKKFFDNLAKNVDDIRTRHANQHIPQIIGAIKEYAATGNQYYYNVANNFWDMVTSRYAFSIGSVGKGEKFTEPYTQAESIASNTNCETCTAYNMLKLTKNLAEYDPDNAKYMDYYERTLLNHVVASQNQADDSNHVTYMLPIGPGQSKSYSDDYNTFTCCHGTGMENHVKYQEATYYHSLDNSKLYVNLYMPTEMNWKEKGVKIQQETQFPSDYSKITIHGNASFDLRLRVPYWATNSYVVKVNGKTVISDATPSSYVSISRSWKDGDTVEVSMPFSLHLDKTPDKLDGSTVASVMYGPIVMVGKTEDTKWKTLNLSPNLSETIDVESDTKGSSKDSLNLTSNGLTFIPMYMAYNCAYDTYFKINTIGTDNSTVDKADLIKLYSNCIGINEKENSYTTSSWNTFTLAMEDAKSVLNNVSATQKQINDAKGRLMNAANELIKITDPTDITLNHSTLSLKVGASKSLVATVTPSNVADKTVTWSSSNANIAVVNESGQVTAKSAGTATITAETWNGKTATCTVTVTKADHDNGNDENENKSSKPVVPSTPVPTTTYVSDTTHDLTVNNTYQFKITSKDSKTPTFVIGTPGVFEIESTIRNGNDYFIKLRAIGAPGDKAGIYINNGQRLLVATVGSNPNYVKLDTGKQLSIRAGKTYQFRVTAAKRPTFVCGTGSTFRVAFAGSKGNDYFFKVTATGKAGAKAGFYVNSEKVPRTIGTIIS